ncbi:MAG TPA: hypothetical protein VMX33_12970 [bacterium]|nr:hypothetical protein [bacterium]
MKRLGIIILTFAVALTLSGCSALDALLQVNILKSLAAVSPDEIKSADSATLLDLSASSSFYETLAGDAATKTAALDTIDAALPGANAVDKQELLALAANIELQTTPAGDLINNIGSLISDLIGGTEPSAADIEGLVRDILPDSVLDADGAIEKDAFLAMIAGLEAADDHYIELGNTISTGVYAPGINFVPGDIAQSALVTALVVAIGDQGYSSTGEYLYALLTVPATSDPATFAFPVMTLGTPLGNLLDAANISF